MATLHGHAAGNGGHGQGEPTGTAPVLDPTCEGWGRRRPHLLGEDYGLVRGHPAGSAQVLHEGLREAARVAVVEVFDAGREL